MDISSKYEIKNAVVKGNNQTFDGKVLNAEMYEENIVVIGPQNYIHVTGDWKRKLAGFVIKWDAGPNGKLMFIHQAMRRIFLNPDLNWTIIIYIEGYSSDQISAMVLAVTNKLNYCKIVKLTRKEQVVNYLNTKDANNSGSTSNERSLTKIKQLNFYCHGLVLILAMGITNHCETDADLDITMPTVQKINKDGFAKNSSIYCFSCRTGLGNDKISDSVFYEKEVNTGLFSYQIEKKQYNLLSAQSLAQAFADTTKATTYAYLCRSEYSDTLNTADELDFKDYYKAGQSGQKTERKNDVYEYLLKNDGNTENDDKRYKDLQAISTRRIYIHGAWFDPEGARYPVRGGTTPIGLPNDMKTFTPLK